MAHALVGAQKTVAEIVATSWTEDMHESVVTVFAKVEGIYLESGRCYITCAQCSKKLNVRDGLYFCNIFNQACRYHMIRYRVHVYVGDETGQTIFTIYNKDAEKLFDTSANKLANRLGERTDGFPVELSTLTGRSFEFKIRLPDYLNDDYDFHNYIVVGLSEIDSVPEVRIGSLPKQKRKRLTKLFPVVPSAAGPLKPASSIETVASFCKDDDVAEVSTPAKKRA